MNRGRKSRSRTMSFGKNLALLYYWSGAQVRLVFPSFPPLDPVDGHRLCLPLERQRRERGDRRRRGEGVIEGQGDEDLLRAGFGAQPGGDVDRIADHGVFQPAVAADVAGEDV